MDGRQMEKRAQDIISGHGKTPGELVPILLDIQDAFGYLPKEAIALVSRHLGVNAGQVYSVASFYKRFQLTPVGKRRITVCRGTACHIRGAPQIVSEIEKTIGIKEGETSADLEYTLETVACIGCCALAPCLKVNATVHGAMTAPRARVLFPEANGRKHGS
jgi:NADH-quinone oxidoreductase subunit E